MPAGETEVIGSIPGVGCAACGYVGTVSLPRCPRCRSELRAAKFGPYGTVWASTVIRIAVPQRNPPHGLAYVDLDNGPRVLAHIPGDIPLRVGARVEITDSQGSADISVKESE